MASTQTSNTEGKLSWAPRKSSTEIKPDAPEGEWESLIPKGKCKVTKTQNGDPRLLIPFKLLEAMDEKNEAYQGSEVSLGIIFFDDDDATKRRGANMMKTKLRGLCTALDVDMGEVYPTSITSPEDFDPLIAAIEGQKLKIWTTHNKRIDQRSGEEQTDTEVRFTKPGSGLVTKGADKDEEDEPPKKSAKKAAGRGR